MHKLPPSKVYILNLEAQAFPQRRTFLWSRRFPPAKRFFHSFCFHGIHHLWRAINYCVLQRFDPEVRCSGAIGAETELWLRDTPAETAAAWDFATRHAARSEETYELQS